MHAKDFKQIVFAFIIQRCCSGVVGRCSKIHSSKKIPQDLITLNVAVKESKHIWLVYVKVLTFAQFKCFFHF